jgi:hypothetical protein
MGLRSIQEAGRREVTYYKQLWIVIQGMGLYCLVRSIFEASTGVSRFITWRIAGQDSMGAYARAFYIESFVYAGLLLVPAWVLLVKTGWCTRLMTEMSGPPDELEEVEAEA